MCYVVSWDNWYSYSLEVYSNTVVFARKLTFRTCYHIVFSDIEIAQTMDRHTLKQRFLDTHIQTWYNLEPMLQDASFRRYYRVKTPVITYVLMDSPPEHYSTKPFEEIAEWLVNNNLSAPQIFHRDRENGFLLIEDFGDILLQQILKEDRTSHYKRAMDVLVELHRIKPPEWLEYYSNEMFLKELEIFTDYYVPLVNQAGTTAQLNTSTIAKSQYLSTWAKVLTQLPDLGSVITLKDYHVQNLMHLEGREDTKSLGILDFQDAVIGSPIYDVVSILEDAREDVDFEFAKEIFDYYLEKRPHINKEDAYLAYDILAAQRNIRILGVFARKKIRDKNENYLQFIPRLLNYIQRDLENPVFSEVKKCHEVFLA